MTAITLMTSDLKGHHREVETEGAQVLIDHDGTCYLLQGYPGSDGRQVFIQIRSKLIGHHHANEGPSE